MSLSQTHFSDPAMELAQQIDELTLLVLSGRLSTALELANAESDPLKKALSTAAIYASTGNVKALTKSVEAAVAVAPEDSLVLQAQSILLAVQGKTAAAVEKATDAMAKLTSTEAIQRAQLGLARLMLIDGTNNKYAREEGIELLKSMATYGKDADANLVLAEELGEDTRLTYLAAAFIANPRDSRSMQTLTEIFKDQSWPIGLGILTRHLRDVTTSDDLRIVSDYIGLAAGLFMANTPWVKLLPFDDALYQQVRASSKDAPPLVQCTLAGLLIDHGRFEDAEALLGEIESNLGYPAQYAHHAFTLGRLHQARSDFDTAIKEYARAFDIDHNHTDAACNFVDLSLSSASDDATLNAIREVLMAIPTAKRRNHIQLSYNEGLWREAVGDFEEGLKVVKALLEGPTGGLESHIRNLQERLRRAQSAN